MSTALLCLFIVSSAIHLVFSWRDDARGRAYTKPWPLLLLIFYFLASADRIDILLLLALITSWLGDVLLIPKGHKWFYIGGISFTFTHLFFMLEFMNRIRFGAVNWFILIPVGIVYYAISLLVVHFVKENTPRMLVPPMYVYLICNSTMNIFALMNLMNMHNVGSIVAYIGALFFFTSDCILYLVRYYPREDLIPKRHFPVMLLYLSGEFLIIFGLSVLSL